MENFQFNIIGDQDPITSDPFFHWLELNVDRANLELSALKYAIKYLEELGFVVGTHKVSERDLDTLKVVFDTWCLVTPYFKPCKFGDLFTNGTHYHLSGAESRGIVKPWRTNITPTLKNMVENAGWIYEVEPNTTYFELNGNRLFAKYQQILGSRFLCCILED